MGVTPTSAHPVESPYVVRSTRAPEGVDVNAIDALTLGQSATSAESSPTISSARRAIANALSNWFSSARRRASGIATTRAQAWSRNRA